MPSLPSALDPQRSLDQRRRAVQNLFDFVVGDDLADTRRQPSCVIDEGPQRTGRRYEPRGETHGLPVLLVPPLGAPASAMDLRRGCSLAEHLVDAGRPTYLVDYGEIGFSERELGLEHWVTDVVPAAVRAVSEGAGGEDVALVGWCLGGIFSLVTAAAFPELPVAAVAMVGSPFDWSANRMFEPLRAVGKVTGGRVLGGVAR